MKIVANGEERDVTGVATVSELLAALKVKMPEMVSVEYNGEILDRKRFADTPIKEGDRVEFLYFMGGGTAHSEER